MYYKQTTQECKHCLPKKECVWIEDEYIKRLCITDEYDYYTSQAIEECRRNLKKTLQFED